MTPSTSSTPGWRSCSNSRVRQFASSGFRIWNLSREAKLVYTGFAIFSLLAIFVSMLFYEDLVGGGTAGVKRYYAGEEARAPILAPIVPGGPKMDLPDEAPRERIVAAVTYRKLLEVTHFHLFTVPVFLLIVAHLFMLTGLSPRAKSIWIACAWLSALVHLGAPWIVRYGSAAWAWLYPVSGAALAITTTALTLYPIAVMWARKPEREKTST